jgi:superfamily II DNA/RNA helicase
MLVASAGCLRGLVENGVVSLDAVRCVVFVGIDRMLEEFRGCVITWLLETLPPIEQRQTIVTADEFSEQVQGQIAGGRAMLRDDFALIIAMIARGCFLTAFLFQWRGC